MSKKERSIVLVVAAVALGALLLQLVLSMRLHFATSDEVTHLCE